MARQDANCVIVSGGGDDTSRHLGVGGYVGIFKSERLTVWGWLLDVVDDPRTALAGEKFHRKMHI